MNAITQRDGLTETYKDVEKLICSITYKFQKRYGGDFDELLAEANYLYILACETHNELKANLSTWLHFKIWKGLLDFQNMLWEINPYCKKVPFEDYLLEEIAATRITKPFIDLLDEMRNDCKTITNIITEDLIEFPNITKKMSMRNVKALLKRHLKEKLHWTGRRIKESFIEMEGIVAHV